MVFGMIGKYIRLLKLRENASPKVEISKTEHQNISRIRGILMNRALIPSTFDHVGPEKSDEEDQFYKYRNDLVDIFKNTLDIPESKETVLNELTQYLQTLSPQVSIEQIELPYFLLFHFAEKVNDISAILKSENMYSQLIGRLLNYPIPSHKIVVKIYLENVVRYSSFFESPEHILVFPTALQHLLKSLSCSDEDVKKHGVYMLYRLAIKNCANLVGYVETVMQSIMHALQSEICIESRTQLYKTIGLMIGSRNISPVVQMQLFSNICDMVCVNISQDSVFVFTEILSGFNKKVSADLAVKLTQSLDLILTAALQAESNLNSIKNLCLLLQKTIDTLEEDSARYLKVGLEYLIGVVNSDTLDFFFQVLSNSCHKLKNNLQNFVPIAKLQELIRWFIQNINYPTETISDLAQQSIALRRSLVKILDVLIVSLPQVFDFPDTIELLNYIGAMTFNFIESSTPKLALALLGKFIEKIAVNAPEHQISQHIIAICSQSTVSIINEKKKNLQSPDVTQSVGELVNLHKKMFIFYRLIGKEENFCQSLTGMIGLASAEEYLKNLKTSINSDQKTSHEINLIMKEIILSIIS